MEFDIDKFKEDIKDLKNTLYKTRKATYQDIASRADIPYDTLYNIVSNRVNTPNVILFHKISMLTGKSINDYLIEHQGKKEIIELN